MAWSTAQSDWQRFLDLTRVSVPLAKFDADRWREAPEKPDFVREFAAQAELTLREAEEVTDLLLLPAFVGRIDPEGAIAA